MKRSTLKKESGAEGRKRRKLEAEEARKSSQFFITFFEKPGSSNSTSNEELHADVAVPVAVTRSVLQAEDKPKECLSQVEQVKVDNNDDQQICKITNIEGERDSGRNDVIIGPVDLILPQEVEETRNKFLKVVEQHDIGLLTFDKDTGKPLVSDALRTELVKLGSKHFQNSEGPFLPTNNRSMNKTWFKRKLGNGCGEEVTRSWLVYSPSKMSAFCICCLLFSRSDHQSALVQETGFNQWKAPERMSVHENAKSHRECFTEWKEMERNLSENRSLIDSELWSQIKKEKQKWRDILTRILHCIKYLATQNLALRGHRESLAHDKDCNMGNFLGLLKLLATVDPVMKEHLKCVESHPGSTSYLSPGIQNEFIHLMANTVRQNLLRKIHKAKYYGIMFDSTPDQAHREQLSETVRYVEVDFEKKTICVRESFLGFILINKKDAEGLVAEILSQLQEDGMKLQDCRSQCYDNAAVMAGHRSGVHQRIREMNNLAVFVNCDNHSLNLVGVHAAKQDVLMVTFFGTIEALYVFFSRSTQRWQKLKNAVPIVVKSDSETRWSAKAESVKPINNHLADILKVLQDMTDDENETSETKSDAFQLYHRILSYDFLTLLGFWNKILVSIDRVQKRLQDPTMNFHDAALDLQALGDYFDNEREVLVCESLRKGLSICQEFDVEYERRRRRKKKMDGENSRDTGLTAKEEMERVMKGTLDRIHNEMKERFVRLNDIDSKFGFLLDVKTLFCDVESDDLKEKCKNLGDVYRCDIDGQQLYEEILDCKILLSTRKTIIILRPEHLLEFIVQYGDESVFPNLRIAIQILLTIAVSIASCERSFSKLKLILSYLRASMGQRRLCDLALLSIEREETEETDFNDMIETFSSMKARKINL